MDIKRLRRETPGCARGIHLHHSGSSLMPEPVLDAVKQHLDLEAAIGGYEAEEQAQLQVRRLYESAAQMLNCAATEVAFVENATVAWNAVAYGYCRNLAPGDKVITVKAEYASNYIALLQIQKWTGIEIVVVPDDEYGQLDVDALKRCMDDRVRLICVTHVPTSGGLVNPAAQVGEIARKYGVPYLLDACQSVGQMPLNVAEIGCHALSATGRKFLRGPRGTGFLYVDHDFMMGFEPPVLDLHSARWTETNRYVICDDARRFENFDDNVAGKIGLAVAIDYALDLGLDNIDRRIQSLAERTRTGLDSITGVTVRDKGQHRCGIVTFTHDNHSPTHIQQSLAAQDIRVGKTETASTRLDLEDRNIDEMVRCPVHYFNTEQEIDVFLEAVAAIV